MSGRARNEADPSRGAGFFLQEASMKQLQPRTRRIRQERSRTRIAATQPVPASRPATLDAAEVFAPRAGDGALLGPYEDVYPISRGYAITDLSER
jgi:hypothetical protein